MKEIDCKIDLLDPQNLAYIEKVAFIHLHMPSEWRNDFKPDMDMLPTIISNMQGQTESRKNVIFVATTKDETKEEIIGFHWLECVYANEIFGEIYSLWIHPDYRGKGIATQLKQQGENWLIKQGASSVKTKVYNANKHMIAINQHLGFNTEMVRMVKPLITAKAK